MSRKNEEIVKDRMKKLDLGIEIKLNGILETGLKQGK